MAGLDVALHDVAGVLRELRALYAEFDRRGEAFRATGENPHLCRAGCSHCCKSGAVFAATLAEALPWVMAIAALPPAIREPARADAARLLALQRQVFADGRTPPDAAPRRDDAAFTARLARLNATHPACPLLVDDLCATYADRPLLCRAYGFPVDAYAAARPDALVFRSLCVLYEGKTLTDYVRARDLRDQLDALSARLAGGEPPGRFTSVEIILAMLPGHLPAGTNE
jgi:hypothetical protein